MSVRTISRLVQSTDEHVGSFAIKNLLPNRELKQIDPFLLIHHLPASKLAAGNPMRIAPHPHAGFEVMTYLLEGEFFHRDSKGNDQVAFPGDVNWMTSGSGIVHSEGPTESFARQANPVVSLFQVWINLPAAQKKIEAGFRHFPSATFPFLRDQYSTLKILLGGQAGQLSPIDTVTPIYLYHLTMVKGHSLDLTIDASDSAGAYLMRGQVRSAGQILEAGILAAYQFDGDRLSFEALEDSELIIFGGLPIKEKVVSYGPFVMNSMEQIQEAVLNYEQGRMGKLEY